MRPRENRPRPSSTSWQSVGRQYDKSVGDAGHYYHQNVVLPGAVRLLRLNETKGASVLELGCGQGVLARRLPPNTVYLGVDNASTLIDSAKRQDRDPAHRYVTADATKPIPADKKDFTHGAIILALQNMNPGEAAINNLGKHLRPGGRAVIVLNHPCFRIPRQSGWGVDEANKQQFRKVNRYLSPMNIPIQANPSQGARSAMTMSFHHPLADYFRWLSAAGFAVDALEEWASDKTSEGKAARMENLARAEIPLFLSLSAVKRP